eukprot:CAMPEP_0171608864 /NCGR_PEP_ID=MMETSP0990-20121206/9158_1 /TAXON_ID=483369 /ORGANISM="non described non described, Strain CCMP2098" /LENGTH=78 /DNA_ID=CAMNT_0012172065 /DNA_START=262 /DNA_END=498 /DNA_ORIENTATION=+
MEGEGIDKGAVPIAKCRVYHHANRLRHSNQLVIFKKDAEWDVLGLDAFELACLSESHFYRFSSINLDAFFLQDLFQFI